MAVRPIAISTGKNNKKKGVRIVPNPKPEKKESREAKKDTTAISSNSID